MKEILSKDRSDQYASKLPATVHFNNTMQIPQYAMILPSIWKLIHYIFLVQGATVLIYQI